MPSKACKSQERKLLESSALMVAGKFGNQFIGLLSTLILARILLPEDFGNIAFISIIVHFFYILTEGGLFEFIVVNENIKSREINEAWSFNLLLRVFSLVILLVLIPFVLEYFGKEQLALGVYVISVTIILRALKNPGFDLYQKNLDYTKIFQLSIISKLISFVCVVPLAFVLQSYWAMIIGEIVFNISLLIGSYKLHRFRPRFICRGYGQVASFSRWMIGRSIFNYAKTNSDLLLISKISDVHTLGGYTLAKEIVYSPLVAIIVPLTDPLLSFFSLNKKDNRESQLYIGLLCLFIFVAPISASFLFWSEEIVYALLGSNWVTYSELFQIFSLSFAFAAPYTIFASYMLSEGGIRYLTKIDFSYSIFFIGCLFVFAKDARTVIEVMLVSNVLLFIALLLGTRTVTLMRFGACVFVISLVLFIVWLCRELAGASIGCITNVPFWVKPYVEILLFWVYYFILVTLKFFVLKKSWQYASNICN